MPPTRQDLTFIIVEIGEVGVFTRAETHALLAAAGHRITRCNVLVLANSPDTKAGNLAGHKFI